METINVKNITKVSNETKTMDSVPINPIDIVYVLDESGSMMSMGNEPCDSMNRTVEDQKALNIPGTKFSLVKFNNSVTVVHDDVPLEDVPKFTDYSPKNMTALYDAIGTAIENKKSKGEGRYDNVICVILTDGLENCSKEYTLNSIKMMIKEMENKHSWKFVYAAANQDAFSVGATMGVSNCVDYEPTQCGLAFMSREISGGIAKMRSGESASVDIYNNNEINKESVSAPIIVGSPRTPTRLPRMMKESTGYVFGSPPKLKRTRNLNRITLSPPPPPLQVSKNEEGGSDDEGIEGGIDGLREISAMDFSYLLKEEL
jgi:hypothetical protein